MKVIFNSKKTFSKIQQEVFEDESRFKVCAWGRRAGKSYLSTYLLILSALKKPNQNYFFIAPTFSQARMILWDIIKDKTRNGFAKNVNESRLEVELINGSKIFLKGGDRPDTMRGVSLDGVVFDEMATLRNSKQVWNEVIRPALSDKQGWALFISSPTGRDYFYQLYTEAKNKDGWQSWQRTTLDGGNVPKEEIESAKQDLSERSFRQEYLASFEDRSGLIFYDVVQRPIKEEEIKGLECRGGLDFGWSDETAFTVNYVDKINKKFYIYDGFLETHLLIENIYKKIVKSRHHKIQIFGDNADPQAIASLKSKGLHRIKASVKGKDSVNIGIDFLQGFEIIVNSHLDFALNAFNNYVWDVDKQGESTGKPCHDYSHVPDSARYSVSDLYMNRAKARGIRKPRGL